ncbi:MAG: hypothetical protein JSR44_12165 [Spirochaetes bacterium]|nr:hypothetical protein [Spirochaetota bacterium]
MRLSLLPAGIILCCASCSTSKISIRKSALLQVQSVAVMPFTSTIADANVRRDTTQNFSSALIDSGLSVVEREKLDKLLKEKALAQSGLVDNKALETSQFLGAQATLFGEITAYSRKSEEYLRTVQAITTFGPGTPTGVMSVGNPHVTPTEQVPDTRETYEFQVVIRLVSNIDGQTILTAQNEYPVQVFTADTAGTKPANLDEYRSWVLSQMASDLTKAIKDARN